MRILNSPYLRIIISIVQIYLGLQFLGVLPGLTNTGTVLSYVIGGVLLLGGVFGIFQAIKNRNAIETVHLTEKDSDEVRRLVREGKEIQAMTFVRKQTGASIVEAKELVESIDKAPAHSDRN
jgi:hypothetical protein